jgi:hypothetical protein
VPERHCRSDGVSEVLGLGDGERVVIVLTFGYPSHARDPAPHFAGEWLARADRKSFGEVVQPRVVAERADRVGEPTGQPAVGRQCVGARGRRRGAIHAINPLPRPNREPAGTARGPRSAVADRLERGPVQSSARAAKSRPMNHSGNT